MGDVQTFVCFELGSLDGPFLADLVAHHLGFEPTRIEANDILRRRGRFRPAKHVPMIAEAKEIAFLDLDCGELLTPTFSIVTAWDCQQLYWELPDTCPPLALMEKLTGRPGFNMAIAADTEDTRWQSEELVSNYELHKRPHDHLPKIMDEDTDWLWIDIFQNPGARYDFVGGWLQAAWRMWFGELMFQFMPKERLLAFPHAERVEELSTGAVFIELYADPAACDTPEARRRQHLFREWTGLPELARRAPELSKGRGPDDPSIDIEQGQFPHGGVTRLTIWYDAQGKQDRRSRAASKVVTEIGPDNKKVWSVELGPYEDVDQDSPPS